MSTLRIYVVMGKKIKDPVMAFKSRSRVQTYVQHHNELDLNPENWYYFTPIDYVDDNDTLGV